VTLKINGNIAKSIAKVPFSFFLTVTMVSTWNDQNSVYDLIVLVGFFFHNFKVQQNRTLKNCGFILDTVFLFCLCLNEMIPQQ